jgi:HK97 family phage prohead protease
MTADLETRADMSAADINDLSDDQFAYIEPGGTKDDSGKTTPRSLRHFPIHDKAHADNAAVRIAQGAKFGAEALPKVKAAQKKFGSDTESKAAARPGLELMRRRRGSMIRKAERRGLLLEMRTKPDGTGGTTFEFEGYGATFDSPFEMWDPWGDAYTEVVRQGAFSRTLAAAPDVPFLIGHNDAGIPLARTKNGSMQLSQDTHGLHVKAAMDGGRSDVRNLASAVERGDLDEMSIGFVTMGHEWSPDWETRAMTDLELHRGDVSAVALAANPGTAGSTMVALSAARPGERRTPTQPYTAHAGETNECPVCHSVNDDTAKHCDQCGHAMMPASHVSNMAGVEDMTQQCSDCQKWNSADAKFCGNCGNSLATDPGGEHPAWWSSRRPAEQRAQGEIEDTSSRPDYNLPANDPANNGSGPVKCPYTKKNGCGEMNAAGNRFCGSCGGPLYGADGSLVLDDSGVVESVEGAEGDANLLSRRLRLLELA